MPNPLSRVLPGAGFSVGPATQALGSNERLARLAMESIGTFAQAERQILDIYMTLAGGSRADATAVYMSLEADSARRAALTALARNHLDRREQKLLSAILKLIQRCAKERNRLAHWVWGHSQHLPDALLLGDPRFISPTLDDTVRYTLRVAATGGEGIEEMDARINALSDAIRDHLLVYTEKDFSRIIAANLRAEKLASKLKLVLQNAPLHSREKVLPELEAEPEIAEILSPSQAQQTPLE